MTAEDYGIVQGLLERGEVIRQGDRDLVFVASVEGKWWAAILRRAEDKPDELYLKSFHRTNEEQMRRNRAGGEVVRERSE